MRPVGGMFYIPSSQCLGSWWATTSAVAYAPLLTPTEKLRHPFLAAVRLHVLQSRYLPSEGRNVTISGTLPRIEDLPVKQFFNA